jgi:LCP family protein required for cell wall assembly
VISVADFSLTRKRVLIVGALLLALILGGGAYLVASTWGGVNRVSIQPPTAAGEDDPQPANNGDPEVGAEEPEVISVPPSGDGTDVVVMVGSDSRKDLEDTEGFGDFDGERADVILVLLRERNTSGKLGILSIPRDLWVERICGAGSYRINDALEGCDDMNGPSVVVETVEDLIGVPVDHFALVDLAGFQEAVDAVGGYEICVERRVRDVRANLALPAGCTHADGSQTLAWLRSRHTQELTEEGWQQIAGVSDLTRNDRQREFMIFMMGYMGDLSNPQDIIGVAQAIAPYVTVDDQLSLMNAVGLATTINGMGSGAFEELLIPVADFTADSGAAVLVPTVDPSMIVSDFLDGLRAEGGVGEAG